MGLHGIHPRVLSELMKVITLLLSRTTCKEFVAWGLVSSPMWQEVGQEEMASIYTREGLGWILGDIFFSQKDCQALEKAAQESGEITIPGGI